MKKSSSQSLFTVKRIFVAGFAMFAMFFGSGNLVFPLLIGKSAMGQYPWAISGFVISGVVIPFLGLLGILLYNGSYMNFFARLGKVVSFVLIFFLLSLVGPFGVIPRCITVSYGSFLTLFPETPLAIFSFLMCVLVFFLSVRENKVVPLLGTILAPAKILSVGFIVLFGFLYAAQPALSTLTDTQAFKSGLYEGYQTMDLMAAFFFATVVMNYLVKSQNEDSQESPLMFKTAVGAMLIGGGLMSAVYLGMVYLGATYASDLGSARPEQFLAVIAHISLGALSGKIVTAAIVLACLTTAIALTTTFTDFVYEHLFKKRFERSHCLAMSTLISFVFSTFGFSGIAGYLGPILSALYPLLIVYTLFNIGAWIWENYLKKSTFSNNTICNK
ncbi:Branched-chain amino acid transport system 2 carrier protein [Candidatus Bealeia paramacronuclearis]|uniref:Branched-chain amino acid transport system carrier protein n=1 Tax=Candidatus Bealeia paramacronuclearis TaxID=1921001 RepID=A0ABZ2C710_9PROT|nr:Branched-chain amino acid transport system 2 carrier protein [Candidatus Bealeia paramacronuclearis]